MTANEITESEIAAYTAANTPPATCSCGKAQKVVAMSCATGWGTYMDGACAWCYLNAYRAEVRAVWATEPATWETSEPETHALWIQAFVAAYQRHRPGAPFTPASNLPLDGTETQIALQVTNPDVAWDQVVEYEAFRTGMRQLRPSWWAEAIPGWQDRVTDLEAIMLSAYDPNDPWVNSGIRDLFQDIIGRRSAMRQALAGGFRRIPKGNSASELLRSRLAAPLVFEPAGVDPVDLEFQGGWLETLLGDHSMQWNDWDNLIADIRTPGAYADYEYDMPVRGAPCTDEQISVQTLSEAAEAFLQVCDDLAVILARRRMPTVEEIQETQGARTREAAALDGLTVRNHDTLLDDALDQYFRLADVGTDNPRMTRRPDLVREKFGEHAEALIERMDSLEAELRSMPQIQAPGIGLESAERARHYLEAAHPELNGNAVITLGWLFRFDPPR